MRLFTLLLLAGLLAAAPASAQSQTTADAKRAQRTTTLHSTILSPQPAAARGAGALFFDGFEASAATPGDPPVGWVVDNVNGDDRTWLALTSAASGPRIRTGDAAAAVLWNPGLPADDWLISPGFDLENGVRYNVSFWFKPGDTGSGTAESIELAIGTEQTTAGMTTILADIDNEAAGDYIEVMASYTPTSAGTFFLGFHCNSAADQYFCAVDDVMVDPAPTGPVARVSPGSIDFGSVPVGTPAEVTVTVTNTGSSLLTIPDAGVVISSDGEFSFGDLSSSDDTLDPGQSMSFGVTFTPAVEGVATGALTVVSDDPASPSEGSLTGVGVPPPANDSAANATPISSAGTYTGSNAFASMDDGEPTPSCQAAVDYSVYWAYTPTGTGTIDIDLSASDFDTVLTFSESNGTEIACDDDGGDSLTSMLSGLSVTSGATYLIRVLGYSGLGGGRGNISFVLTETFNPVAIGDDPDAAYRLSAPQPNPTAGTFRMALTMAAAEAVRVAVYDALGREVAVVHDGPVAAGETMLVGATGGLPAGRYLVLATGASFTHTRALTVVR